MLEEWRPVVGRPDGYAISDHGRVWSHKHRRYLRPRYLKRPGHRQGYWRICLYRRDGASTNCAIHTLILEAFIGQRPPGTECAHLDGNTDHNILSNLAWVTSAENHRQRREHGMMAYGERNGQVKVPDETVRTVVDAVAGGMAIRAAARHYGIPGTTVHQWVHRIYRPIARAERP